MAKVLISQTKKYEQEFAMELCVALRSVDILIFKMGNIFSNISPTQPVRTYLHMGHPSSSD